MKQLTIQYISEYNKTLNTDLLKNKYMRLLIFISLLLLISCSENILKQHNKIEIGKYYKDYNIFERKGLNPIDSTKLNGLFFAEIDNTDSTILLVIYENRKELNRITIPKEDNIIYNFSDIYDGPRHYFSKVSGKDIIRYSYDYHPNQFLEEDGREEKMIYEIVPSYVELITSDTLIVFSLNCYYDKFENNMNTSIEIDNIEEHSIMPFSLDLKKLMDSNCDREILYFEDDDLHSNDSNFEKLYIFERKFDIWKPFHDINRIW